MWEHQIIIKGSSAEFLSALQNHCNATSFFELRSQGHGKYQMYPTKKLIKQKESEGIPRIAGFPFSRVMQWPIIKVSIFTDRACFRIVPDDVTKCINLYLSSFLLFGGSVYYLVNGLLRNNDRFMPILASAIILACGSFNLLQYYYWVHDDDGFHVLDESLIAFLKESANQGNCKEE